MIIVDDFIKDESFLRELQEDTTFFDNNGKYMWWGGPWSSPASTLKQRLIEEIWIKNSPWDFPRYKSITLEGFEYWTGQFSDSGSYNSELKTHFDKDEFIWDTEQRVVTPIIGSVYYPIPMGIDGGYLEIHSNGQESEPERIAAKHNRLIIFPAGEYHHRVTEVTRGLRSAIAINLWNPAPLGVKNGDIILEK
jgi:predicted 2-oxoglutarate/Fe(II)-dependent dioxygenase YbiX